MRKNTRASAGISERYLAMWAAKAGVSSARRSAAGAPVRPASRRRRLRAGREPQEGDSPFVAPRPAVNGRRGPRRSPRARSRALASGQRVGFDHAGSRSGQTVNCSRCTSPSSPTPPSIAEPAAPKPTCPGWMPPKSDKVSDGDGPSPGQCGRLVNDPVPFHARGRTRGRPRARLVERPQPARELVAQEQACRAGCHGAARPSFSTVASWVR